MKPVLFDLGGLQIQSYGVSKALAALVAARLLQGELVRRGRDPEPAFTLAIADLVGGFVGAKLYLLVENAGGAMDHGLLSARARWRGWPRSPWPSPTVADLLR